MSYVLDYIPLILKGMLLTVEVALLSLFISVVLGMIGALPSCLDPALPKVWRASIRQSSEGCPIWF